MNGFIVDAIEEKLVYNGTQIECDISHMRAMKEMEEMTDEEAHLPQEIIEAK